MFSLAHRERWRHGRFVSAAAFCRSSTCVKTRTGSTASTSTATSQTQSSLFTRFRQSLQSPTWRRLAVAVRYTRIPVLVASVYSMGYQKGIMDCTKQPELLQQQILQSILLSVGVTRAQDVEIVSETDLFSYLLSPKRHHQVASVADKIVSAARALVQEELQTAMNAVKEALPSDITQRQALEMYAVDETVQFWQQARLRLQGEHVQNNPWQYLLINSPSANAFVTEMLPQRFFITTSMLQVATNPDELAVVLGHEVSHLILGHVSEANLFETILRTLEVLLLSLDPTSGALALIVIGSLAATRKALSAAHSRDAEYQADELGLRIASRACFDTQRGCEVIRKMHEHRVAAQPDLSKHQATKGQSIMDTHPPTLERYEKLKEQSNSENWTKYEKMQCAPKMSKQRLVNAIWGSSNNNSNNNNNNNNNTADKVD